MPMVNMPLVTQYSCWNAYTRKLVNTVEQKDCFVDDVQEVLLWQRERAMRLSV